MRAGVRRRARERIARASSYRGECLQDPTRQFYDVSMASAPATSLFVIGTSLILSMT